MQVDEIYVKANDIRKVKTMISFLLLRPERVLTIIKRNIRSNNGGFMRFSFSEIFQ